MAALDFIAKKYHEQERDYIWWRDEAPKFNCYSQEYCERMADEARKTMSYYAEATIALEAKEDEKH